MTEPTKKIKEIIAPNQAQRKKRLDAFKQVAYYLIIAAILIIVLFVVPFLAGGLNAKDFGYYLPKSKMGWIVFWAIRGGTVAGNIAVYILFKQQAITNSKDHPNYIKAKEMLCDLNGEEGFIPHSPKQKLTKDYLTKGITVVIMTAAESIVIGALVISFDAITFLSCLTSSITAVLFGIVAMIKDEVYWTEEYLLYAEYENKKRGLVSPEIAPEPTETAKESNVSKEGEVLPQEEEKETENA